MKLIRVFIFVVLSLSPFLVLSQGEGNIWYFGVTAGLDFNSGSPVPLLDGQLSTNEGCATICDSSGDLLFYTDGSTVWNSFHGIMPNGTGLLGNSSSTQSGVIVPQPGNPDIYYIFTVDDNIGADGCRYSVVDLSLGGGFGAVVAAQKNILLFSPSSEKIAAVNHANGQDIWIITHPWNSGTFFTYLLTTAGFSPVPIQSTCGSFYSGASSNTRGYLKASPDGSYVVAAIEGMDRYELFNFNNTNGTLTTFLISPTAYMDAYGVEFSPDGTLLYGSRRWGNQVFQWNLTSGNPGTIMASQTQIATLSTSYGGALQLASDGKIYLARSGQQYLGVINNPNTSGIGCSYVEPGVFLNGRTSREGLPTFIASFFNLADYSYEYQCVGDFTEFFVTDTSLLDSAFWFFDDPFSGLAGASWLINPTHVFSNPGTYDVTLITFRAGYGDTITYPIEIYPYPEVFLGNDTSICTGSTIVLNAGNPGGDFLWSNGSTGQTLSVMPWDTTTYYVDVIVNNCQSSDTITLMPFDLTSNFTISEIVCYGDEVNIEYIGNADPNATYNWNFTGANIISGTGQGPYVINWSNAGTYSVSLEVVQGSCSSAVTSFPMINPPDLDLAITGNDVLCFGDATGEIFLSVTGGDGLYSFAWNAGYNDQNLLGVPAGTYSVSVSYDIVCVSVISYTIDEPATPISSSVIGNSIQCFGETSGFTDLTPAGGTSPYTYSWSFNNETTQDLEDLAAGYYTVTVWDENNCVTTDGVLISEPTQVGITTSIDVSICEGESATIHAFPFGGTPAYTINWIGNGSGDSITVNPGETTQYQVFAIDDNSCYSDTVSINVIIYPPVFTMASIASDSICFGDSTFIDADFSGGNGGPYMCLIDSVLVVLPFQVSPDVTTTYVIEGQDNCESPTISMEVTVIVLALPSNNFDSDIKSGCQPLEVSFFDTNSEEGQTYLWLFGENGDYSFSIDQNPTHIFENAGVYDIDLTTTSSFGCVYSFRFPEMINVYEKPFAEFYPDPNRVSIKSPIVYFENMSVNAAESIWDFGDGTIIRSDFPVVPHEYSDTGLYKVSLFVESGLACLDTSVLNVEVYDETNFNAPNVFTPLSSNINNTVFKPSIYGINPDDYHLIVYDRWGEKIFESFNYYHGWNGEVKGGNIAKEGSYLWVVRYIDENGLSQQEAGSVILLK